jgi:hypothetical protein
VTVSHVGKQVSLSGMTGISKREDGVEGNFIIVWTGERSD